MLKNPLRGEIEGSVLPEGGEGATPPLDCCELFPMVEAPHSINSNVVNV